MAEWQPIETAPKDGTMIRVKRVGCGDNNIFPVRARFLDGEWVCSALFVDRKTKQTHRTPTHWMPWHPWSK